MSNFIYTPASAAQPNTLIRRQLPLFKTANPTGEGTSTERFPTLMRTIFIERVERQCSIYVGTGKQYFLGDFSLGQRQVFHIPTGVDEVTVEWIDFAEILNRIPIPEPYEQPDPPFLTVWVSDGIVDYNSFPDDGQSAKVVRPQTVWTNDDRQMTEGTRRALSPNRYGLVVQNDAQPHRIATVFAAAGVTLVGALWLPDTANVLLKLHKLDVTISSTSAAAVIMFTLRALTGDDTNWNAGHILSGFLGTNFVDSSAQWNTTFNPGNPPTPLGQEISAIMYRLGITGAGTTDTPPLALPWQTLYDDSVPDGLGPGEISPQGGVRGFGLYLDSDNPTTITWIARMFFSEYGAKTLPFTGAQT